MIHMFPICLATCDFWQARRDTVSLIDDTDTGLITSHLTWPRFFEKPISRRLRRCLDRCGTGVAVETPAAKTQEVTATRIGNTM